MIVDARGDRSVLEKLLRIYWPPVYTFIRRQGFTTHDASDLTQEFLSTVVLSRDLLSRADPTRGRFRSFLKQSLRNFLIDHHRAAKPRRAITNAGQLHDADSRESDSSTRGLGFDEPTRSGAANAPTADFDRQWAATIVHLALERLEDSLRTEHMTKHWLAFETNVVAPAVRKTAPLPLDELAQRLHVAGPDVVSNMVQTAKRKYRKILREIVAETVDKPEAVDSELNELRGYFQQRD